MCWWSRCQYTLTGCCLYHAAITQLRHRAKIAKWLFRPCRASSIYRLTTTISIILSESAHSFRTLFPAFLCVLRQLRALSAVQDGFKLCSNHPQCRPHQVRRLEAFIFFGAQFYPLGHFSMLTWVITGRKASLRSTSERRRVSRRPLQSANMFGVALSIRGTTSPLELSGLG